MFKSTPMTKSETCVCEECMSQTTKRPYNSANDVALIAGCPHVVTKIAWHLYGTSVTAVGGPQAHAQLQVCYCPPKLLPASRKLGQATQSYGDLPSYMTNTADGIICTNSQQHKRVTHTVMSTTNSPSLSCDVTLAALAPARRPLTVAGSDLL